MTDSRPIAEDTLLFSISIAEFVDMENSNNGDLASTVGISAQIGLNGQPGRPDDSRCPGAVDLRTIFQASFDQPALLVSPGQTLALLESCYGATLVKRGNTMSFSG